LTVTDRLAEIPAIGYFPEGFTYPMVLENGVEWMAIKPNEIETMRLPIAKAHGRVLTYGLGLGYFAYLAARRPEVTSLTVVERDKDVIALFEQEILPQLEVRDKIRIIEADAFAFAESEAARDFDYVFCDLWHDAGDGLPLYIRMRRIEEKQQDVAYEYWVEDMILSRLRAMVYDSLQAGNPRVTDIETMYNMLTDAYLRRLAPDLRAVGE
jgi:SAM-dependent methyltransferase